MIDKNKVCGALKNCLNEPRCRDCPWDECEEDHRSVHCPWGLVNSAYLLLTQEIEPNEDEYGSFYCGACGMKIYHCQSYCSECGRKVKWNDT